MKVTVTGNRVYLDLDPGHAGTDGHRWRTTGPLGKYGVRCDWDGRGELLGIEVPIPDGQHITVESADLGTILAPNPAYT
jgi:hypothetical protein